MMIDPAERDERVMALAAEALKTPGSERESFLKSQCCDDPELYREVSEVVTWEERMAGFLNRPLLEFIDIEAVEKVFEPGQTVAGRFEILRCVGDGGMGVVYEAFDTKRGLRVAIKCAKPGFGRLLSPELEGALKVRHPNICMVNEIHTTATEAGDLDFLTMEFLDGETLSRRLLRGSLDEAEALAIARQLCAGVAEAHRSDILHRDLKSGNIILCRKRDGTTRAVITDFGLATESHVTGELGGGTPSYMAPELRHGGRASQASDVFSLGVILYEMVTGRKPFPSTAESNGDMHAPAAPSKLVKGLPHRWDQAILPCLRPRADERCSAAQALAALERKPLYRRPAMAVAAAALLVLAVVATPGVIDLFRPAPYRLVVLPAQATGELAQRGQEILDAVAERVEKAQSGKATVSVISPAKASRKGVSTPEEAARVFGATHALEVRLRPEAGGVSAEGAIVDLRTMAHVRDYSGRFAADDLIALPGGLTGSIALALHLHRKATPETVAQAADSAYKRGRSYLSREPIDFADAIQEFEMAARLDPHSPLPLAGLAEAKAREFQARRQEGPKKEAQAWLAKAESLDADSRRVRLASGLLHLIQGDYPKALADYQRVEESEPGNVEALLGSGLAYELQRMLDRAIIDYRQAIAADPKNSKPYEYLGALYFSDGHYAEAAEMYKQAIALDSDRSILYGSLAGSYIALAKYQEAEDAFNRSPRKNSLMLNNFGAKLALQKQDVDAIGYYRLALDQNPADPIAWLNLGDSERRVRDFASARKSYQQAMKLAEDQLATNPGKAFMRAQLAYLQARLGLSSQARPQIAQALGSPSADDQVILCAVQTYEVMGERKNALAAAARANSPTRQQIARHPDLADLQRDSRFTLLMAQPK